MMPLDEILALLDRPACSCCGELLSYGDVIMTDDLYGPRDIATHTVTRLQRSATYRYRMDWEYRCDDDGRWYSGCGPLAWTVRSGTPRALLRALEITR